MRLESVAPGNNLQWLLMADFYILASYTLQIAYNGNVLLYNLKSKRETQL